MRVINLDFTVPEEGKMIVEKLKGWWELVIPYPHLPCQRGKNYTSFRIKSSTGEKKSLLIYIPNHHITFENLPERLYVKNPVIGLRREKRNYYVSYTNTPYLFLPKVATEPRENLEGKTLVLLRGWGKKTQWTRGKSHLHFSQPPEMVYTWKSYSRTGAHWEEYYLIVSLKPLHVAVIYEHGKNRIVKKILKEV